LLRKILAKLESAPVNASKFFSKQKVGDKMPQEYDIVVIGAGPAGSTAARFAAAGGARVLVLERNHETGEKIRCGEGVTAKGLKEFIQPDAAWISSEIDGADIYAPNGERASLGKVGKGYVLERKKFDAELCRLACAAGAELMTQANACNLRYADQRLLGVEYFHLGQKKFVSCDLVIAADGVESRVGRWAGLKTKLAADQLDVSLSYKIDNILLPSQTLQFYFGNSLAPGGYLWVFPKSSQSANIGLAIIGERSSEYNLQQSLDDFLEQKFPTARVREKFYGCIPIAAGLPEIVADHLLLAGDAARQVNPLTGGGITQALVGGKLAGIRAAAAVKAQRFERQFLQKYQANWQKRLGKYHQIYAKLAGRLMTKSDANLNQLIESCQAISPQKNVLKVLLLKSLRRNPKEVIKLVKALLG